ncbi:MAG: histidine kinase [Defluviitaleaceae bacterium]|nr:histidine kinase [Defluviitaleaceae bacterium]
MKRLTLFTKIFLVFLITISPLYILSVYFNSFGREQVRQEMRTALMGNIELYISNIESSIAWIINSSAQFVNNDDTHIIGNHDTLPTDLETINQVRRIQHILAGTSGIFEYMAEVYVLFPHSGMKITQRNLLPMTPLDVLQAGDPSFFTGFPFIHCLHSGGTYINFSSQYHLAHYRQPLVEEVRWIVVTQIDTARIKSDTLAFFNENIAFVGGVNGLSINADATGEILAYRHSAALDSTFLLFGSESEMFNILSFFSWHILILTAVMVGLFALFVLATHRVILPIHRAAIDKLHEQEMTIKDTELKMLQYQINPHFLYNTFFTMYQMLQASQYDGLKQIMFHMGRYFSFITKSEDFIPLADEMQFCIDYMEIQTLRFSNRITAEIEPLPDEIKNLRLPRLSLQPLLENCFKHGLANKEENGMVRLRYYINETTVKIHIEDNGDELTNDALELINQALSAQKQASALGLRNVHKRLQSRFGAQYGITAKRSELGGLLVEVELPKCINY